MSHLAESASRSEASNWDVVSAWRLKGKACPISRRRAKTQLPSTASSSSISPDKTCQKPALFWQVLEADGEGDLMIVFGYGS